jgi:hypothetical protein
MLEAIDGERAIHSRAEVKFVRAVSTMQIFLAISLVCTIY